MWTAEGLVRPGIYIWPQELQSPIPARLTRALLIRVRREIPVRQRTLVPLRIRARPIHVQPGDLADLPIIKNAVLYLTDIQKGKAFKASSVFQIDQRGCQFHPHVLIVPAGKTFTLINSDGILHNFLTNSTKNPILNKAQPKFKKKLKIKINKPPTGRIGAKTQFNSSLIES